ncbi:nodal homolog [Lates japonicus]|uniref:Nodal homolog n=1 Tax=Lates japonicus TaxID=270547 RepID=A0AAD3N109_LATJO|nr:nodal homolog [Lates japonicus]
MELYEAAASSFRRGPIHGITCRYHMVHLYRISVKLFGRWDSLTYRHRHWVVTCDLHTLLADKQIQAAELRIRLPRTPSTHNVSVEVHDQHGQACHTHKSCQEQQLVGLLTESSLVTSSQSWKVLEFLSWTGSDHRQAELTKVSGRKKVVKTKRAVYDQPVYTARREQDARWPKGAGTSGARENKREPTGVQREGENLSVMI